MRVQYMNTRSGRIDAVRDLVFPPDFSKILISGMSDQISIPFDRDRYQKDLADLDANYSIRDLVRMAGHTYSCIV